MLAVAIFLFFIVSLLICALIIGYALYVYAINHIDDKS